MRGWIVLGSMIVLAACGGDVRTSPSASASASASAVRSPLGPSSHLPPTSSSAPLATKAEDAPKPRLSGSPEVLVPDEVPWVARFVEKLRPACSITQAVGVNARQEEMWIDVSTLEPDEGKRRFDEVALATGLHPPPPDQPIEHPTPTPEFEPFGDFRSPVAILRWSRVPQPEARAKALLAFAPEELRALVTTFVELGWAQKLTVKRFASADATVAVVLTPKATESERWADLLVRAGFKRLGLRSWTRDPSAGGWGGTASDDVPTFSAGVGAWQGPHPGCAPR
jgi:hypothetical protein